MTEQCNLVWLMKKLSLQLDSGTTLAQTVGARKAGLAQGESQPWPWAGGRGGLCPAWFQRNLFNQDAWR